MHFGAYVLDDNSVRPTLVGICSLYKEILAADKNCGWRLRGMAVEPDMRKRYIGASLLNVCYEYVATQADYPCGLWCNARSTVMKYYLNNGFVPLGEEFEMPHIGPHYLMINENPTPKDILIT